MVTFYNLPNEVLINVLSYLPVTDLFRATRTCRALKSIYDGSSRIQYLVELEIAGMVDNPYCHKPLTERLEMLRKREAQWGALQQDFRAFIPIPKRTSGVYDVTPNTYLLGIASPHSEYSTVGLQHVELPSKALESKDWRFVPVSREVVDFGTSIEENDLLAILCVAHDHTLPPAQNRFELVLLRHSTGAPHDLAQNPIIPVVGVGVYSTISIEICGDNLILTIITNSPLNFDAEDTATLQVYDWKKGTIKGKPMNAYNLGLMFLTEDIFLMPNTYTNALDIFQILPGTVDGEQDPAILLLQLGLPSLASPHRVVGVQCRCEPSPIASTSRFPRYMPKDRPFANDPKRAIAIFCFDVMAPGDQATKQLHLFVHRQTLVNLIAEREEDATTESAAAAHIRWERWGPASARWLDAEPISSAFITSTAGERFVSLPTNAPLLPAPISVLDFNPYHVRKVLHDKAQTTPVDGRSSTKAHPAVTGVFGSVPSLPPFSTRPLLSPAKSPASAEEPPKLTSWFPASNGALRCFEGGTVDSQLAYVASSTRQIKFDYDAVLLDEQRIIGLKSAREVHSVNVTGIEVLHFG